MRVSKSGMRKLAIRSLIRCALEQDEKEDLERFRSW